MIPKTAGAAGQKLLFRLLFDPVRLVRQPASYHLKRRGHADIAAALKQVTDYQLDDRTSKMSAGAFLRKLDARGLENAVRTLAGHEQWEVRAREAWLLGHPP